MTEQHFPVDGIGNDRLGRAVQILTTEQFNLQSGRSSTIAEANGRLSIFLSTTSSTLIAIAFIGQISNLGLAFHVFVLLLLPALLFLGLLTLARVGQIAGEDTLYTTGLNRIRHFYVEVMPEISDYLVLSTHDDFEGRLASSGIAPSRWQPLLALPAMVAVINSMIAAVLVGLLTAWLVAPPNALSGAVGIVCGILLLAAEAAYGRKALSRERGRSALFPTQPSTAALP